MSSLSQFAGGGRIKSIQRGTIMVVSTAAAATITAVNTAKTMLNFCGCSSGLGGGGAFSIVARIALTSSTQITANANLNSTNVPTTVSYEVIEYF